MFVVVVVVLYHRLQIVVTVFNTFPGPRTLHQAHPRLTVRAEKAVLAILLPRDKLCGRQLYTNISARYRGGFFVRIAAADAVSTHGRSPGRR